MIREATEADIPEIVAMGRRFFDANKWPDGVLFSPEVTERTVRHLMADDNAVVLVADGGMISGVVFPFYFSGQMAGQEFWWWIDPEHRGGRLAFRLFDALENWGRSRGAMFFTMVDLESGGSVAPFYLRRGYMPMEHHYMRAL